MVVNRISKMGARGGGGGRGGRGGGGGGTMRSVTVNYMGYSKTYTLNETMGIYNTEYARQEKAYSESLSQQAKSATTEQLQGVIKAYQGKVGKAAVAADFTKKAKGVKSGKMDDNALNYRVGSFGHMTLQNIATNSLRYNIAKQELSKRK